MHYRVRGVIASSLQEQGLKLTYKELANILDMCENHIRLEQKAMKIKESNALLGANILRNCMYLPKILFILNNNST